jgi:hypothetical protein
VRPQSPGVDVSVITVSYNTRDLTRACLESVERETRDSRYERIVVDNASADGSAEAIREELPGVRLHALAANTGFGRAANLAAREARGRYLLLLNPDARVLDRAIDRLVAFADQHPEAGIYGGVTLFPDGSPNPSSCWRRPTLWSLLCQALGLAALFPGSPLFDPERVRLAGERECEVDIVSGGFLLIRAELWRRLGGFDPDYFMYSEDSDLCLRARALGARPRVLTEARIVHQGRASERVAADRLVRFLRARVQFFDRHWSAVGAFAGRLSLLLWVLTRRLGYRAAALLRRSVGPESAGAWDEVWRRRGEFLRPGRIPLRADGAR